MQKINKAKIFIIPALILSLSLLFSACGNSQAENREGSERALTHPGQYLTDKISSFKLGDREFGIDNDYEGFREVFGDEMTAWYSPDKLGEESNYDNKIMTHIVQNEVYSGDLEFAYDKNSKKFELWVLRSEFDYGDRETFDFAIDISYTENGEVKKKDFPIEVDKIAASIDDLNTGTATAKQIEQYLGKGKYESGDNYSREIFAFEDYTLVTYYDGGGIFKAMTLYPANFKELA
ncbi:MAG: hypothetical protein NC203_08650 [Firmicutes bacterium]|nr:hypothetical protein [[Eubacterium] siraeum]MCM1488421.1 hypothetical protein [Bacillota bacterium]